VKHGANNDQNCAQRLSASQRWALVLERHPLIFEIVLNAFRHHRGGRSGSPRGSGGPALCSTPFGITEVGAPNATPLMQTWMECSTPFGITEVGAWKMFVPPFWLKLCSTPFGITEVGAIKQLIGARLVC